MTAVAAPKPDVIQPSLEHYVEVPKPATREQVKFFVDQGYLAIPGLITPAELEELKQDTYKIARGGYPCETLKSLPATMSDDELLKNILCIHQPHYISPVMQKFVRHPLMCGVLSQIIGAHLAHWDGSVKCMQSMLFAKPPQFQGQAWHQDEIYIPTRDRSLCGAWIAIDDATIRNGCLYVVPGSHRDGYLYHQRNHSNYDEFDFSGESYGFDESKQVPVEVKAGSVVFFNGYLLHRSFKNRSSNEYRRVLVNHYCNAWSKLPWSLKEGESPASADRRVTISVAGFDPYAWKGQEDTGKNVWLRGCKASNPEALAPKPAPKADEKK